MSDLITRLRLTSVAWMNDADLGGAAADADEAADEIERLTAVAERSHNAGFVEASRIHGAEVERLRAAAQQARAALRSMAIHTQQVYEALRALDAALGEKT